MAKADVPVSALRRVPRGVNSRADTMRATAMVALVVSDRPPVSAGDLLRIYFTSMQ